MTNQLKKIPKIHEDKNVLVLNKPCGLVVNRSHTSPKDTLQDLLSNHFDFSGLDQESEFVNRCGIVHRLDKDTSGVLLIAKNEHTFYSLQKEFKERRVKKNYVALVWGAVENSHIEINAPIIRNPSNRTKFVVSKKGKDAKTIAEVQKSVRVGDKDLTLMNVTPVTGRTHQIRVHMTAMNHPIVGDPVYSSKKQVEWATAHGFKRMMLHANKIEILDQFFEAELPTEFQNIMK